MLNLQITCFQAAESFAITCAFIPGPGNNITVHTDSQHALNVCLDFHALWKNQVFLTSEGKPIAHRSLIINLLSVLLLPVSVAVCKCKAHTISNDPVSLGNVAADATSKTTHHNQNQTTVLIPKGKLFLFQILRAK